MKLFRDKNRGPKTRREDVIIPKEYLEYEREAEERRHAEDSIQPIEEVEVEASVENVDVGEIFVEEPVDDAIPIEEPLEGTLEEVVKEKKKRTRHSLFKKREKTLEKSSTGLRIDKRLIGLIVGTTLLVTLLVCLLGPLMAIDHVEINGIKNLTKEQVLQIAEYPQTHNLFLYRTSKAEKELKLQPYVKDVKVKRHLPHWISIEIEERIPAGILLDNGHYIQFSKDGILLDNTQTLLNPALPIITGFSMKDIPAPGERFRDNDRFKDALEIVNACSDDLLPMIQEINIKDRQNILAYTNQGIEIRLGNIKQIQSRMNALNDIMSQVILSNTVEEPIEALDIRYEKAPVIVLKGYHNAAEENRQKYIAEERAKMEAEKQEAAMKEKEEAAKKEAAANEKTETATNAKTTPTA